MTLIIPIRVVRFACICLMLLLCALSVSTPRHAALQADDITPTQQAPQAPEWDGTLRRIRVPILMYHYISPLPEDADEYRKDLTIEPQVFRQHMEYLFYEGYTPISLYDLDEALLTGKALPTKPVVLTFDDGYNDAYTHAFPILKQFKFTGTFFIITARVDANDPQYLTWDQVREMSDAGMSMEAHTKNHPDLRDRSYDFLVYEILGSVESLAAYTGKQPMMLSYPMGRYDAAVIALVKAIPMWRAVTTQNGRFHTTDNRFEVPRVRIHGNFGVSALSAVLTQDPLPPSTP